MFNTACNMHSEQNDNWMVTVSICLLHAFYSDSITYIHRTRNSRSEQTTKVHALRVHEVCCLQHWLLNCQNTDTERAHFCFISPFCAERVRTSIPHSLHEREHCGAGELPAAKKALSERNHPEKVLYRNARSESWINSWVSRPVYLLG